MNQDDIDQEEWNNRKNWSWLTYSSQRDSRAMVPKRFGFGWTINFGNKKGRHWFAVFMAIPVIGLIAAIIAAVVCGRK